MERPEENDGLNPYAPPVVTECAVSQPVVFYHPAGNGKRFLNYLIDQVGIMGIGFILAFVLVILEEFGLAGGSVHWLENAPDLVLGVLIGGVYYATLETLTGRSLGKLITRTKVVDVQTGRRPSLPKALGRTLVRFIPFEPFSFFRPSTRRVA